MNQLEKAEVSILGTCLYSPENSEKVFEILITEHFSTKEHQRIFETIKNLYTTGKGYDMLLVTKELHSKGILEQVGGAYYISSLTQHSVLTADIEQYCYIVLESFLRRSINKLGLDITIKSSNPISDIFDVISEIEKTVEKLSQKIAVDTYKSVEVVKDDVLVSTTKAVHEGVSDGIKSGINRLNLQTNGWQPSDLIILAGRPGMGKTSAAIDFGLMPAKDKKPVLFFSLEMSSEQITKRILSILSGVDVQKVVNNTLSKDELKTVIKYSDELNGLPLYLDDTPSISLFDLKTKAKKIKKEKGLSLIIIDYLQLMRSDNKKANSREQEISEISRGLKALAKELSVPVIALSQLSRKCEERADKKPMLSDLRESGAIEQDADMVIFCHRPEYYGINEYEIGGNVISSNGLFVFNIAKFRNGQTGDVRAGWIGNNTMVTNYVDPNERVSLPNNDSFINPF